MNLAHIHLVLNHIPIVGIPVAVIFLVYGFYQKNAAAQKMSLIVLFLLAAIVVPVYLTGEPAEKVVEHLPGVSEAFIEPHEEAALISMILTLITGVVAFVAIWFQQDPKKCRKVNSSVMCLACVSTLSLMYTASLGGKIRHTELRSASEVQTSNQSELKKEDDHD